MKILCVILFFIINLISFQVSFAQFKVKEKSVKNQPQWVLKQEEKNITVQGIGSTLEESKAMATDSAKLKVLILIADNMLNSSKYFRSIEIGKEDAMHLVSGEEQIERISNQGDQAIYWEKLVNKKSKEIRYIYYLNFFIEPSAIQTIVKNLETEILDDTLANLKEQLAGSRNIQVLKNIWEKVMFLNPLFPDDSENKQKCDKVLQEVDIILSQIELQEVMNIPGKLIVAQTLNDRAVVTSIPPKVTSNCMNILSIDNSTDKWIINYSYNKCQPGASNSIHVAFDNAYKKLEKEYAIDIAKEKVDVQMSNTTISIKRNIITFFVSSLYRENVVLERIVFRFNDINYTDTKLNLLLEGRGLYNFSFDLPQGFESVDLEEVVRGELYYRSEKNGHEEVYRFYNQSVRRY